MKTALVISVLALTAAGSHGIAGEAGSQPGAESSNHWAFVAPVRPPVPQPVNRKSEIVNPIDSFVRARLKAAGLKPSPEADRPTLVRRLSLDLTGLPPALAEVEAFVNDLQPGAYERLVDRLLASPHFGEHWGRHWLDLARYADSDGYEKDNPRPNAYLYRDWVITALNRDLPFDQFTLEQLAGDLLPDAAEAQHVATGFHRQTLTNREGGVDPEEFRCKAIVDRASTTATVWLGLTLGCAECHSHKFDPFTQREFYQFYAFFNNATERDHPMPTDAEKSAHQAALKKWQARLDELEAKLARLAPDALKTTELAGDKAADDTPDGEPAVKPEPEGTVQKLKSDLQKHRKAKPVFKPTAAPALASENRDTHIHIRGDFLQKGDKVEPGVPAVLHPLHPRGAIADRLDLARWIVSPHNPLTARVTVNHVWRQLFGHGLVATENDFGTRGDRPSHPELLDWLAVEFMEGDGVLGLASGGERSSPKSQAPDPRAQTQDPKSQTQDARPWSLKHLIRLIVTSATYRQSSTWRADVAGRDPLNVLLARQARFRVEAEVVRDIALGVSGLLNAQVGGPSFKPALPADLARLSYANGLKWEPAREAELFRRGLYIHFQRTVPFPMLTAFDAPESNVACTRRERSNSPLQALTLLNNETFTQCAQALGRRIAERDMAGRLRYGFQLVTGRPPAGNELARLQRFWAGQRDLFEKNPDAARQLLGATPQASDSALPDTATCTAYARVLLNLDETITRE